MKRVSWSAGWGGFYLIGRRGAKLRCRFGSPDGAKRNPGRQPATGFPGLRSASSGLPVIAFSTPRRPCRRYREQQPADDQECAAGWRGKRKQTVAGILPQRQVAGEQRRGDDKA